VSDKIVRVIRTPIHENSSYDFELADFFQIDDSALTISDVKVYVYLAGDYDPPVYINDRDGSNNEGLTLLNNAVSFHMSPKDNVIVLTDKPHRYETHTVLFEIFYNSGADKFYVEFELKIKNLSVVN
jgi:hypothetical protein